MSSNKIPLSEMIQTLREELEEAQENAKNSKLKFETESVELELSIAISKTGKGKGGIKFWVIEAGGEFEKANSIFHKFKLSLKPKSTESDGPFNVSGESKNEQSNN